jgi:hypothetical protein
MDISMELIVLNHAQLDIGIIQTTFVLNATIHVILVTVLLKTTVLIVSSVKDGYTTNNVLTHAQPVIMVMNLEFVNHVTPLVKHVLGQDTINVPNVKKDTINNHLILMEVRDQLSLMLMKNTQVPSNV